MAISRADFSSFISELVTRNPNLGIPALEDGLFANLLILNYLYYIFLGRKKEGKREGKKGREKGKGQGKGYYSNRPSCGDGHLRGTLPRPLKTH